MVGMDDGIGDIVAVGDGPGILGMGGVCRYAK